MFARQTRQRVMPFRMRKCFLINLTKQRLGACTPTDCTSLVSASSEAAQLYVCDFDRVPNSELKLNCSARVWLRVVCGWDWVYVLQTITKINVMESLILTCASECTTGFVLGMPQWNLCMQIGCWGFEEDWIVNVLRFGRFKRITLWVCECDFELLVVGLFQIVNSCIGLVSDVSICNSMSQMQWLRAQACMTCIINYVFIS